MKICSKCKINKPIADFQKQKGRAFGVRSNCKKCCKEYLAKNKVRCSNYFKEYYSLNKHKILAGRKIYEKENRKTINEYKRSYNKLRRSSDPLYKLTMNLRHRLNIALNARRWKKTTKFYVYIGCSLQELKAHLESKFQPGMTWDNYGDWHIDHIIPLASATSDEQLYSLCHYSNLQPLWAIDNIKKSNKII